MIRKISPSVRHRGPSCGVWVVAVCVAALPCAVNAAESSRGATQPIVDHAVVPAGGARCRHCGDAGCRLHQGHLAGCRDGLCAPHCPVRPNEYGFYRTQWRRWPGQGVVPVNAEEAATPAAPQPVQVPTADEESPRGRQDDPVPPADGERGDLPAGENPDAGPPPRQARPAAGLPTEPIPEQPGPIDPAAKPAVRAPRVPDPTPPVPPEEPTVPPKSDTQENGLFDQSAPAPSTADPPVDAGAMRYPEQVGRSLAAGATPWRLQTTAR